MTLSGNGRLTPADVIESEDHPRRLVLDFPNVTAKAPAQTQIDGGLVTKVRVALNSQRPLITRVVMELGPGATYHVERAGTNGGDLAVVFEPPQSAGTIMLAAPTSLASPAAAEAEPDIPMDQAIANAASLTPRESPADPVAAMKAASARRVSTPAAAAAPPAAAIAAQPRTAARAVSQAPPAPAPAPPPPAPAAAAQPPGGSVILSGATDKKVHRQSDHAGLLRRRPAHRSQVLP